MKAVQFLLLLMSFLWQVDPGFSRLMNYTGITNDFNTKYMSNLTTWISDGNVNIDITTIRVLDYGLRGNIGVQIKISNSQQYQTLFSYDFDQCKMLNELFQGTLLRLWFRYVLKYGNIMENCPMAIDKYYVHNAHMDSNMIPVFLRPGNYRITVIHYYGKRKTKSYEMVCRFNVDMKIY